MKLKLINLFLILTLFKMKLFIKPHDPYVKEYYENIANTRSTDYSDDSGFDLIVPFDVTVPAKAKGFKIKHLISCRYEYNDDASIKMGYYLYPRSSISKTPLRMSNSVGIIDWGYRGDIMAAIDNLSDEDYHIEKKTRLFQICSPTLQRIKEIEIVNDLDNTDRGDGGFGSTD
tara:strand:+ start:68 stop:586 length:519 start_codon:yes stop_codon:yes gene_type:complete